MKFIETRNRLVFIDFTKSDISYLEQKQDVYNRRVIHVIITSEFPTNTESYNMINHIADYSRRICREKKSRITIYATQLVIDYIKYNTDLYNMKLDNIQFIPVSVDMSKPFLNIASNECRWKFSTKKYMELKGSSSCRSDRGIQVLKYKKNNSSNIIEFPCAEYNFYFQNKF